MPKRLYLTTPLYYVNARPHIGHAYTTIIADCLARWHRLMGFEVFLLTGTDEHGEKIAQAAAAAGLSPKAFVDQNSKTFQQLWTKLGISYDHFIRTTDPEHQRIVQLVLEKLKPVLKLGTYKFWYCVPCETSIGLSEVDPAKPVCPQCQRPIKQLEEEDYFLPLENYRGWLKQHLEKEPKTVAPSVRRNEVLGLLNGPLPDLCITRPKDRVSWGIQVPFSPNHVTYVWFDALLNYISALDWPDGAKFKEYWQETGAIHLIGKDIIRHHAVYWPIILEALKIRPPLTLLAHGWWLVKGEKMSKSKGNIVDPEAVIDAYGLDSLRYFLLRDVPFGEDGVFSEEALVKRINADLANDLGNLVYRTLTMLEKHASGRIPSAGVSDDFRKRVEETEQKISADLMRVPPDPSLSLQALWGFINWANKSIEQKAPWTLAKEGKRKELEEFLYELSDILRVTALFLWAFMPTTAESIWQQLGFDPEQKPLKDQRLPAALQESIPSGQVIRKGNPLFPRISAPPTNFGGWRRMT